MLGGIGLDVQCFRAQRLQHRLPHGSEQHGRDHGFDGEIIRLNSEDSIIPLGPAANTVLLGEDTIFEAIMDRQENVT